MHKSPASRRIKQILERNRHPGIEPLDNFDGPELLKTIQVLKKIKKLQNRVRQEMQAVYNSPDFVFSVSFDQCALLNMLPETLSFTDPTSAVIKLLYQTVLDEMSTGQWAVVRQFHKKA